jgi:small subunit ribosomal protein S18
VNLLRRFMSERAKIRARRVTGNDQQQQAAVAKAIKLAREMALLPYSVRQVTQRSKGRRDRDDRGDRGRDRDDRELQADAVSGEVAEAGGEEYGEEVDELVGAENGNGEGTEDAGAEDDEA